MLGFRTALRKEKGWAYSSPAKGPEEYLPKCPTKTWLRVAAAAHAGAGESEDEAEPQNRGDAGVNAGGRGCMEISMGPEQTWMLLCSDPARRRPRPSTLLYN